MPPKMSKTAAKAIVSAKRKAQALDLRIQGLSYTEIASQVGVARQHCHRYVVDALAEINEHAAEEAAELRRLESERLDQMLVALSKKIADGDVAAIQVALKIQDRRAKLWGLDSRGEESSLDRALAELLKRGQDEDEG